ncbi:MAG: flippase [Patescibacteria group bacterium]
MSYTVAQNTTFLTSASILQKVVSFLYFILVARLIGVENTGQYFFAITFTTIFVVVADFGFAAVLIREASRYPENTEKYLNTTLVTKILFGLGAYALVVFFVNVFNYPALTKDLIYLSGITMFFDNLTNTFSGTLRSRKNLVYESIGIVGAQLVTMGIGTVALLNHWPLIWLIIAYTIPSALYCLYLAICVRKLYAIKYNFIWDKDIFKIFFITALPFAIAAIIGRLYSYSDSLLMSKMLTIKELGWWAIPYKIAFAFQFVPLALSASVYPVFSGLFVKDKTQIGPLFEKSWRYLFTIIFPLSVGLIVLADPVITLIYGPSYAPSINPLRILMGSLIFTFLGLITGALLNATNRQKTQTWLVGVALVVSVVLNLILLPILRLNGAAISVLVSNTVLVVGGYLFARRELNIKFRNILKYINQTLWPAVVMGGVVYYLSLKINFIWTIPIGAVVYFGLLFLTGGINIGQIKNIINKIFKNKTQISV